MKVHSGDLVCRHPRLLEAALHVLLLIVGKHIITESAAGRCFPQVSVFIVQSGIVNSFFITLEFLLRFLWFSSCWLCTLQLRCNYSQAPNQTFTFHQQQCKKASWLVLNSERQDNSRTTKHSSWGLFTSAVLQILICCFLWRCLCKIKSRDECCKLTIMLRCWSSQYVCPNKWIKTNQRHKQHRDQFRCKLAKLSVFLFHLL